MVRSEYVLRWKRIQDIRISLAALQKREKYYADRNYRVGLSYIVKVVQDDRRILKGKSEYRPIQKEIDQIVSTIMNLVKHLQGRTRYSVYVGKEKKVYYERDKYAPKIKFYVGHMWRRRVYNVFYLNRNIDEEVFIIDAERIKVNDRAVILYEALVWRRSTDDTRRCYIGQSKLGEMKAVIKNTAHAAAEAARRISSDEVEKRLKGEFE